MKNVYESLEEKILSGEYKIGEQITENRISAELGV
ncbi:MAG: GntR family transcriptional regulator, partial [Clostridia bacterium]|nr:GntR family transcriptional regulator [Clostridia bacterium]